MSDVNIEIHAENLRALATEAAGQSEILWLDGDTLGVDGSEIGVFEERHEVSLSSLLEGHDSRRLEAEIGLEVLSDLTNETLEGELADQELSGLLVATNLAQGDGTRAEAMGLLHTTSRGGLGGLASGLGGELLTRGLATSGLAGGLLGASH